MGSSRVAIISFMAELWLVGYSIAFVVYGGALAREVKGTRWASGGTPTGGRGGHARGEATTV